MDLRNRKLLFLIVALVVAGLAGLGIWIVIPNEDASDVPSDKIKGKDWCSRAVWGDIIDFEANTQRYESNALAELRDEAGPSMGQQPAGWDGREQCIAGTTFSYPSSLRSHLEEEKSDQNLIESARFTGESGPSSIVAVLGASAVTGEKRTLDPPQSDETLEILQGPREEVVPLWAELIALGTDPQNKYHVDPEWIKDLIDVGRTKLWFDGKGDGRTDYGWSIFAPLLRMSDFSAKFLVPVSVDILKADKELEWVVNPADSSNPYDSESHDKVDPVDPVLDALSKNENAAKKVAKETGDERVEALLKD